MHWCGLFRYVLDGFPLSMKQVELMTERCLIPVRVFELYHCCLHTMITYSILIMHWCVIFRYVLEGFPLSMKQIELMRERCLIPVRVFELYHCCLHTMITYSILIMHWCVIFRYVLDGFPLSMKQVELMTERCLIPVRVFELYHCCLHTMITYSNLIMHWCVIFRYVLDGFPLSMKQVELMTERCLIPVRVFELYHCCLHTMITYSILIMHWCVIFRYVLDGFPLSMKQVELMTERCLIPVRVFELYHCCLHTMITYSNLIMHWCVIFRYVLDGFPLSMKQVELMTERCLIPVRVFELYHCCLHTMITYSILIMHWCVIFRYVLDGFPLSMKQVELMTERCLIPVRVFELYHCCLHTMITYSILIMHWCVIFRYVLDGFPLSMKQVELMTERCLIPVRVFELMVKSKEIMVRGTKDRISSNRYSVVQYHNTVSSHATHPTHRILI